MYLLTHNYDRWPTDTNIRSLNNTVSDLDAHHHEVLMLPRHEKAMVRHNMIHDDAHVCSQVTPLNTLFLIKSILYFKVDHVAEHGISSPVRGLGALRLPSDGMLAQNSVTQLAESTEAHISPRSNHERPRHISFSASSIHHAHRHLHPEPIFDAHEFGAKHRPRTYA